MLKKLRRIYLAISLLSTIYMVKTQPDFFEKILNETVERVNPELAKRMADDYQLPPDIPLSVQAENTAAAEAASKEVQDYLKRAGEANAANEADDSVATQAADVTSLAETVVETPLITAPVVEAITTDREQAIERAVAGTTEPPLAEPPVTQPAASPVTQSGTPAPALETAVIEYKHRQVTTQFLYLKIRRHIVRFNVDDKVDEKAVAKLTAVLKASCVTTVANDGACNSNRRHTITADAGFFTDVESSEKQELARAEDAETLWKFVCADENENCLTSTPKFKSFKLTRTKAGAKNLILARGFESQRVRVNANSKRLPSSTSSTGAFANVEKVFVTQSQTTATDLERAGTIR